MRVLELWAFTPEATYFSHVGRIRVSEAREFAFAPLGLPMDDAHRPRDLKVSPSVRLVKLQEGRHPQGYAAFTPVLTPARPTPAGTVLDYDLSWKADVVPYLHGEGMNHRLLSLTFGPVEDQAERLYGFAIPDTSRIDSVTDFQPTRMRSIPGWKLYEYDATKEGRITVHILFDFGVATATPPSAQVLLEGRPVQ